MPSPYIKICGITNLQDALLCTSAGAHYLGFIFYRKSPRYITPGKAREIIAKLPSTVTPVGVFVNEERSVIEKTVADTNIRIIQLSGDETPDQCADFPIETWKAFRFTGMDEISTAERYKTSAILLDGTTEGMYGGTGKQANLEIALELAKQYRLVLAGGLSPENIGTVLSKVQPFAIDINSGIEFVPGKKDLNKVRTFFQRMHTLYQPS